MRAGDIDAIVEPLEQIVALAGAQRCDGKVVQNNKSVRASCAKCRRKLPSPCATRNSSRSRGALAYSTVKPLRAAR